MRALVAAILLVVLSVQSYAADLDSRAIALLRAVENARLAVPKGKVVITATYNGGIGETSQRLSVLFDEGVRRFQTEHGVCVIHNGSELLHYDGAGAAVIRAPLNDTADYCFDPRIFGITSTYQIDETIESCLAYEGAKRIVFEGAERLNGTLTHHVSVIDNYDQQLDFWIEENDAYRVHRFDFHARGSSLATVTSSEYDAKGFGKGFECLPKRVTSETRRVDSDKVVRRREVVFESLKSVANISADQWKMGALGMERGTPVADLRIKERVGYWDGEGLRETPPIPSQIPKFQPRKRSIWRLFFSISTLLAVSVAAVYSVIRFRRN